MIPTVLLHVAQIEETKAKTPIALRVCQPKKKLGSQAVFVGQLTLITVTTFAHAESLTCLADGEPLLRNDFSGGVISPFLAGFKSRAYAAYLSFIAGVIPPMPMLGRSLL